MSWPRTYSVRKLVVEQTQLFPNRGAQEQLRWGPTRPIGTAYLLTSTMYTGKRALKGQRCRARRRALTKLWPVRDAWAAAMPACQHARRSVPYYVLWLWHGSSW